MHSRLHGLVPDTASNVRCGFGSNARSFRNSGPIQDRRAQRYSRRPTSYISRFAASAIPARPCRRTRISISPARPGCQAESRPDLSRQNHGIALGPSNTLAITTRRL